MRSYPVPAALRADVGAPSLRLPSLRLLAATDGPAAIWADRIVTRHELDLAESLVACGCGDDNDQYYGIMDPESDEPLVVAVVALSPTGAIQRWNGSGWDEVPSEMEPVGFPFVALDDDELLADALHGVQAGGLLLRPTDPKAKFRGTLVASVTMGGQHFAIVDDFDTSAVLDLLEVRPGPVVFVRRNGEWIEDYKILSRLESVDPPRVVEVPPESVDAVAAQVDEYDRAHVDDKALTAAMWDDALHPRDPRGEFSSGSGGSGAGADGQPTLSPDQLRQYVATGQLPADAGTLNALTQAAKASKVTLAGQPIKKGGAKKGAAKKKGGAKKGAAKKGAAKKTAAHNAAHARKLAAAKKTAARKAAAAHARGVGGGSAGAGTGGTKATTAMRAQVAAKQTALKQAAAAKAAARVALRNQWATEDAAAQATDAKFNIARAQADLTENKRRDAAAAALKAEQTALTKQITTGRPKITGRPEDIAVQKAYDDQARKLVAAFQAKAQAEMDRRAKYDQAAKYESAAENIRRMQYKAATQARRAIQMRQVNSPPQTPKAQATKARAALKKPPVKALHAAADPPETSMMPHKLKDYWVDGEGAAKIRWGEGGDFNRCRMHLSKYLNPLQVPGACANLHKAATGIWPGKGQAASAFVASGDEFSTPTHAGVAMVAEDTGRVLMLQRSFKDEEDPARGTWEFPGGGIEDGEFPLEAARREWAEETGVEFPQGAKAADSWDSPNGKYRGFVIVVPSEDDVPVLSNEDRSVINPDDPDGDDTEAVAWWEPEDIPDNPALREEVQDTPWKKLEAITAAGYIGNGSMIAFDVEPEVGSELLSDVQDGNDLPHVTLAYLGEDVDQAILDVAAKIVEEIALEYNAIPATLSGYGTFVESGATSEPDAEYAHYVSVDAPGIETFWVDLTDRLHRAGVPLPGGHGFTPHITLKYGDINDAERPVLPIDTTLGKIKLYSAQSELGTWDMLP